MAKTKLEIVSDQSLELMQQGVKLLIEGSRLETIAEIRELIPQCHDLNRLDQLLERMENE